MSRIWPLFQPWIKNAYHALSKYAIPIAFVAISLCMAHELFLSLLKVLQNWLFTPLQQKGIGGAFVSIVAFYLLKKEWDYRKIYVSYPLFLWLYFLLGVYLYYRHWEGTFSFWPIPYLGKVAWADLMLLPWGGAVAVAALSRSKGDRWTLGFLLVLYCYLLPHLLPQSENQLLQGGALISVFIAVGAYLLIFSFLQKNRWESLGIEGDFLDMRKKSSQSIDPDDAIVSEREDWLGFSEIAKSLCESLKVLDLGKSSLTVGIIATWGKGKSSFINLLKEQVNREGNIIVTFNPRVSKSIASIQGDFFEAFAEELSRHYFGFGLLLARYTKHLGLLNQYAWTRPIGSLLTLLLPGKEQEVVNRTLRKLGRRVYVMIDDLDRLSGEEILEVLKLMDRNASFSNTVFIIAYDKVYVNNVLRKHLNYDLNHCFIDKYISWEFPLPTPDKEMLKLFMEVVLSMKVEDYPPSLYTQLQRDWNGVASIILKSLESVRDLKRYLNLMMPRYQRLASEVSFKDYCLLYLLCYKDFGAYVALQSRELVQLDDSSRSYVLAPNLEIELERVSRWEGTKEILELLFPSMNGDGGKAMSSNSLSQYSQFDIYFGGLKKESRIPYPEAVDWIMYLQYREKTYNAIPVRILIKEHEKIINACLYLATSNLVPEEDRSKTIELMAYVASESWVGNNSSLLWDELSELLSRGRYEKYKEFGIVQDVVAYHQLLEPMVSFLIHKQPSHIFYLIDKAASRDGVPFQECVYSIDQISAILLKCQDAYYKEWKSTADNCKLALQFIFKGYMDSYPQYAELATQRLISLICKYPDECIWMILSRESRTLPDTSCIVLSIDFSLAVLLEKLGFTLEGWRGFLVEKETRYAWDYIMNEPEGELYRCIEFLPDEKVDLDSIDYIYRAILAQEERERQQATSEGEGYGRVN